MSHFLSRHRRASPSDPASSLRCAAREAGFPSGYASSLRCGDGRRFSRPSATPVADSRAAREAGFTLIELLMVISIISILMSMLFPVVMISKRYAEKANTEALLRKVDTALRLFKTDVRVFPWDCRLQPGRLPDGSANPDFDVAYPDLTTPRPSWSNRLYYHLGSRPAAAVRDAVLADAEAARNAFAYDLTNADGNPKSKLEEVPARYSVHAFLTSDSLPYDFSYVTSTATWKPTHNSAMALATVLNRMAQERYPLAMLAGAVNTTGPQLKTVTSPSGGVHASANPKAGLRASSRIVASPASAASPGWADDYLAGELEQRHIAGDAIVDIWKRPLVFVCQVLPGCEPPGKLTPFNGSGVSYINESLYDLGTLGRQPLTVHDGYQQRALAADPPYLPDPNRTLGSDIRRYAAAPYAMEFELWSAGRDGRFAWMRDDPANQDNLGARSYLVGLR